MKELRINQRRKAKVIFFYIFIVFEKKILTYNCDYF